MNVSIIIPTYNRQKQVISLLEYLNNDLGFYGQIIVVDQSDNNQSTDLGLDKYSNVLYYFCTEKGTSKARNFGATHTQAEWICFLDDDVRPALDFFEKSLGFLKKNNWVDVLQPQILQKYDWKKYIALPRDWLVKHNKLNLVRIPPRHDLDGVQWFLSQPIAGYGSSSLCLGGGAFFINRDAFFRVGGFDEIFTGVGDDREFALRLWWFGYQIYSFPDCVAFHLHDDAGGLRSFSKKRSLSSFFYPEPDPGLLYFYYKWFPGYPTIFFYVSYLLKSLRFPLRLPIKILRFLASIRFAKKLMSVSPQYVMRRDPLPRDILPR